MRASGGVMHEQTEPVRIDTHEGYIEVYRDDFNVFEDSPSAVVMTLASDYQDEEVFEVGPTLVRFTGRHGETQLAFPMDAARRFHAELGALIEGAREQPRKGDGE